MRVCLNGAMIDAADARIAPDDRGLLLGDGIFETLAVRGGQARRLAAHLARLRAGAEIIGLALPWTDAALAGFIAAVAADNGLTDAAVRLTVTRGPGPRGLAPPAAAQPTLLIAAAPLPPPPDPARVVIAARTRRNEHSPLARIKSLNYLDNVIARQEAAARGGDDAVLLNSQGRVADSTVANVFALIGGGLVTPPVAEGALPGVMRADVLKLARGEEAPLTPEALAAASEVFLTNSLGIRPVVAVDGTPVGDGAPGLITQLLAARV